MDATTCLFRGVERVNAGDLKEAADAFIQAINLRPDFAEAYCGLGSVFNYAGNLDAAETCLRKAIQLKTNYSEAYQILGLVLGSANRQDEAEAWFREAIKWNSNFLEAHHNLGLLLSETNRTDEAEVCFRRVIELGPDNPSGYNNMGRFLTGLNRLEEAETFLRQALKLNPDYPEAEAALGYVHLMQARYDEGWAKYEARCKLPGNNQPPIRRWQGEDLTGRKILLFHEQGLGDTLQFIRYVEKVAKQAGETVVWVQKPFERLLAGQGGDVTIRSGDAIPLGQYNFDFACPLLSLPKVFHTGKESIPDSIPYIFADSGLSEKWRQAISSLKIDDGFRVGVVWAGNIDNVGGLSRTIPFSVFSRLFDVSEVSWISLQVGVSARDLAGTPYKVADFSQQLEDFAETAGLVENLDLIITVDTSVAHLAAAMGKKTWVLLPFAPDWRWQLHRDDSPWYPSMRLFRQDDDGIWGGVLDRVKVALKEELRSSRG